MANMTLLQARAEVAFFLRPVNAQFYKDAGGTEAIVTSMLNAGLADMCMVKGPYMLWDNHDDACAGDTLLMLDADMISVKRVELLLTEEDASPVLLKRPDDYDIHDTYLEFTSPKTGIIRILATRKLTPLSADADYMPFGDPFQLAVVYYAVSQLCLSGGNAGVSLSAQYMIYYQRIKDLWEKQAFNEITAAWGTNELASPYVHPSASELQGA
jgi:hypothetical protein